MCRFNLLILLLLSFVAGFAPADVLSQQTGEKPRVRDLGLHPGVLKTGSLNAITDVVGVLVGLKRVFGF